MRISSSLTIYQKLIYVTIGKVGYRGFEDAISGVLNCDLGSVRPAEDDSEAAYPCNH